MRRTTARPSRGKTCGSRLGLGHFENLLEVTTTDPRASPGVSSATETSRWRYPPSLLVNNGHNGPMDYINLTEHTSEGEYTPLASVRFNPCDLPD
jgi:hypothetical protein